MSAFTFTLSEEEMPDPIEGDTPESYYARMKLVEAARDENNRGHIGGLPAHDETFVYDSETGRWMARLRSRDAKDAGYIGDRHAQWEHQRSVCRYSLTVVGVIDVRYDSRVLWTLHHPDGGDVGIAETYDAAVQQCTNAVLAGCHGWIEVHGNLWRRYEGGTTARITGGGTYTPYSFGWRICAGAAHFRAQEEGYLTPREAMDACDAAVLEMLASQDTCTVRSWGLTCAGLDSRERSCARRLGHSDEALKALLAKSERGDVMLAEALRYPYPDAWLAASYALATEPVRYTFRRALGGSEGAWEPTWSDLEHVAERARNTRGNR